MRAMVFLFALTACQAPKTDLCATSKQVLAFFLGDIFNDPIYTSTGAILAYPGQQKTDAKPLALHLEVASRQRNDILKFIASDFKSPAKFESCTDVASDIPRSPGFQGIVKDDPSIYKDSTVHVLGTLTLIGIYIDIDDNGRPVKCFLDILRRVSLKSKSQFNDVVEFSLKDGKWIKTASKTFEMS